MTTNPPRNGNRPRRGVKASSITELSGSSGQSPPEDDAEVRPDAPEDLDAMTAFEDLLCHVADLEALAHAAEQASQGLPYTREPNLRRVVRHVQAFISLIADLASRTLAEADAQRESLTTSQRP